jgi:hypothetical protein
MGTLNVVIGINLVHTWFKDNVVNAHLLHRTRGSGAIIRGNQVRAGNVILQLLPH